MVVILYSEGDARRALRSSGAGAASAQGGVGDTPQLMWWTWSRALEIGRAVASATNGRCRITRLKQSSWAVIATDEGSRVSRRTGGWTWPMGRCERLTLGMVSSGLRAASLSFTVTACNGGSDDWIVDSEPGLVRRHCRRHRRHARICDPGRSAGRHRDRPAHRRPGNAPAVGRRAGAPHPALSVRAG